MKTTCMYCGIVDKPHDCPRKPKRKNKYKYREDVRVYNSKAYKRERTNIMDQYNNNCLWSMYVVGEIRPAKEVHHIIEIMENESLGDDPNNMIPLTTDAHELVHKVYATKYKERLQEILRQLKTEYDNKCYDLGKYREEVEKIVSPLGLEIF